MKRLLIALLVTASAWAQTDAPPELDHPFAPDELPPLAPMPKPLDGKLDLVISGASSFPESRLREEVTRHIRSIEDYGLDEASAYDISFFLESFYRKDGFTQALVKATILGPWKLALAITEGPVAQIGTIRIEGNTRFDDATITKYLLGPLRERFPRTRMDSDLPFAEADLFAGTDLVRRLYSAEGYLESYIPPPTLALNADKTQGDILLEIHEGPAYRFGRILFDGPVKDFETDLRKTVREQTQGVFTDGRLAAAVRGLEDFFSKRGYFKATVTSTPDLEGTDPSAVPVTFHLAPGPVFQFDGVSVSGTSGVRPSFIKKRLAHLNGKTYSPGLVDKSFRELIQTGLFRNLRITPEDVGNSELHLNVEIEEAPPKEFGFGVGYATFFGALGSISYQDRNFLGTGRPIRLQAEATQRGFAGEFVYTDPWFLDSPYEFKVRAYAQNAVLKGYSKNELGVQPTLSRQVTPEWKLSAFVSARYKNIFDVEIEPESLVGETNYPVFSVGISQTLDFRNNIAIPTRGFIFSTALELAPSGLGSVSFVRGTGRFSYYLPVTAKTTLALGARAGIISPLGGGGLPIDERYFNGGATTVRSFSEFSLGPRDHAGYPLGGQVFTVFNAEYTFPIIGDLHGAVFVDAGNDLSEASQFGVEDLRYAVGVGLRYHLPIGAIRVDYGLNPTPRDGEAQGAFHFAIGVAF